MLATFLCLSFAGIALADAPAARSLPALFDPAKHMRVDEVRVGMKGYGLSVFNGTKIERFDVEVLSILRNYNPKCDIVLIQCHGPGVDHAGPIQGMSGSPIYLRDEQGRDRMIGAYAYGWPLMKDAIAGVQPIQYMLDFPIRNSPGHENDGGQSASDPKKSSPPEADGKIRWSLDDMPAFRRMIGKATPEKAMTMRASDARLNEMQPLATPLMSSGLSSALIEKFAPLFRDSGMSLVQSGGGAGGNESDPKLEPGAALVCPLLTGDVELSALGTCTEVLGDYVVGFGHPFNNEGRIALPFAGGSVQAVIAKLDMSFKIGSAGKLRGTLFNDQLFGVAGKIGALPPSVPIDVHVSYADGTFNQKYHFDAAIHPKLTPLIVSMAIAKAVGGASELPQYHTVDYSVQMDFSNGKTIDLTNVVVNTDPVALATELSLPMQAAGENPYERITLKRVTATAKITPRARQAQILSVNVPRQKYRQGEMLKAFVTCRPFRAPESNLPVAIQLPRDLPDGSYRLIVSDWQRYLSDEVVSEPFRFSAESADEIFALLRDLTSIRHDAIYVRLMRQADGVAVGRVAMPRLPSSRRQVILGSGRSNTVPFVSSAVKSFRTSNVMEGAAEFEITIDSEAHVEVGGASPTTKP